MERIWGVAGCAIVGGAGDRVGLELVWIGGRPWYLEYGVLVDVVMLEKFTTRKCCGEKMRQRLDRS